MSVKNFVQCGLVTPVAANTTELVLMAPTASYQYPPLDGGTLVIADSVARPSFYEIISYTHRIENVLYGVVRAKEGTTARAWSGVTWIYQALTAQDYVDALALKAPLTSPALTGVPTAPTAPLGTNTQQIATMAAVQAAIANLVASSPAALDTLNELAAALGNDPNFATTINNALAGKEPSIAAGTSAQMWLGNKTWASVLTQVQNTLLTGLGAGSNATILTTDTLIGALAKLQNQLNNKADFTDYRLSDAREWTATEVSQAEAEAGTTTVPRKWSALRVWQAVLASSLTGLNLTVGTAVTATDTVLVAIGKLQKQITDAASNLAGSVRATVLTGYVSGSNVVLASTDTVLAAFGKVQAQITALATSKLDSNANAVSADKLATARTINGVAFDGTANITVADSTKLPLTGGTLTGTLTGRRGVFTGTGNDYHLGGLEVRGNGTGNTVFPTIGFHQPGLYTSSLQLRGGSDFRFYAQGGSSYASVTAANFNGTTCSITGRASVGDVLSQGWLRTIGNTGWYNETYGGGIHMQDATYVRVHNGKAFYCAGNEIVLEGHAPTMRFFDNNWGHRYIHSDGGLIGFLSASYNWTFRVDNDGNAVATGNVTAYSDIRLKKDIELIPDALDKVCALRGVTYERIDSGERQTGVIAQEVQAVLPEAVMTMTDEQQTLSVAYGNLVGLLVEAIKELNHKVDKQAREIAELRAL